MFQLNKKLLIIIIVVLLLGFTSTTAYLIYKENHKEFVLKYEEKDKKEVETKYAINLNGKYNTNDLKINSKEYEISKDDYFGYDAIDGLKNSKYQDKINTDILKQVKSFAKKDNYGYCYIRASYSNVLSISCEYSTKKDEDKSIFYGLNYNLKDEKDLLFEELFVDNAPIESIILKSYYNNKIVYDKDESPDDMIRILIDEYNKGNYVYYFDQESIFLVIKDETIEIDMKEYYKYIAVFDRFKDGKNIYKNDNIGYKNIMPLTLTGVYNDDESDASYEGYQNDYYYISYSYETEKEFLDANKDSKITNKVLKEIYKVYYDEAKKIPDSYKKNNKGVMLYGELSLSDAEFKFYDYETNPIFEIDPYLYSYECSKNVFKDKFVPYFITFEKRDYNTYKKNLKEMGVTTKEVDDEYYVVYKDNKAYSKKKLDVEDIFKDVNKLKEDILNNEFLKDEEKEDLKQNGKFSYEIDNNYITIYLSTENTKTDYSFAFNNN